MAEIETVANWQSKQVINWFKGLEDSLQCYIPNLEEANITGAQLLALNYEDLNNLGIGPVGHQELVLEATQLLKNLHYNLDTENLQSRALDLNCRCRTLRSQISSRRRNDIDASGALRRGPSIPMLRLACDLLDSSKLLVMWLDRPPFFSNHEARKVRSHVVRLSHELSTTVQQTVFACVIEDAVSTICSEIEALTNQLIVSNDPMTIQPSSLEVAHLVNRDSSPGLGLFIKATFEGHHVITGTKEGSISSRIRRITPGDEVVAVGGQTVIGWQLSKLVGALKETPNDISITLKKRPHFSTSSNAVTPTSRRSHQDGHRVLTVPPPVSPIRKVAESRKNSVDDVMESGADISRSASKENLVSPKKNAVKKKKKLKKQKAKSSSNILATAAEGQKKGTKRNSVNSFGSSVDGSLRSASSSEAMLSSSMGNLNKNYDVRKGLERVLKHDRRDSSENAVKEPKRSKGHAEKISGKSRDKKERNHRKHSQDQLLTNVNDVLEELRQKKLRKTEKMSDSGTKNSQSDLKSASTIIPMDVEPPSSPLDILSIPPPPEAPYTPRVENILQVVTDEALNQAISTPKDKASESPNSLLDIEHHRRFTVIGSEQMDEKWYNSLLSEVNAKRSRRNKNRTNGRAVLERLDETTASEDSVFTSQSILAEEIPVVKRAPKPKLRNRPMSMPPNYYSPAKLQQYRVGQGSESLRNRGNLPKMDELSPLKSAGISPVAHQVDENGIRKLAPLACSVENVTSSSSRSNNNSLENRKVNLFNENNSNNGSVRGTQSSQFKTPPKPLPRPAPPSQNKKLDKERENSQEMPVGKSKLTGERLQIKVLPEHPRSTSDEYVGLLQVKPKDSSGKWAPQMKRQRSRTEYGPEPQTPDRSVIADELNKFILRKKAGAGTPTENLLSPAWSDSDPFSPRPQLPKSSTPLGPPVAKPRKKVRSSASTTNAPSPLSSIERSSSPNRRAFHFASPSKNQSPGKIPLKSDNQQKTPKRSPLSPRKKQETGRKSRSKSVDTAEFLNASRGDETRRKSEGVRVAPERSISNISRSSPTSRGSYVAAIDGGFALDNASSRETSLDRSVSRKDSEGHIYKLIDGVPVRLRKSTVKTSPTNKKGRLKIIDQLKASPEMRSQRRISCRDLGEGECVGWLWKKKTTTSTKLASKWTKRWVVLKDDALYCYHTEDDEKAESYISLPGYQVTPAPESKRRFAFRVIHPLRKTFYFASDRQIDMSRWMNKMGLAAIGYTMEGKQNHKENQLKNEQYFSESDSEEASQSGAESSTPNSSPEKTPKGADVTPLTNSQKSAQTPRHISTLPDLNRSARFPRNKSKEILAASTQTDSTEENGKDRSKSEVVPPTPIIETQNDPPIPESSEVVLDPPDLIPVQEPTESSPLISPVKKPTVTAEQRKHKANDTRRNKFLGTSHLSTSLETIQQPTKSIRSSHSEEELRHLKNVAAKKAEEVARRLSSTSLVSNTSVENLQGLANGGGKGKRSPGPQGPPNTLEVTDVGSKSPTSRVVRRDITGRPKLKVDSTEPNQLEAVSPEKKRTSSSIDDLCKALQNADVDIRGVNRRVTLRRKMTILSNDPGKNDLMLRKRALQRQIKALEGELEYYSLLDEKTITSELIHEWMNQHPSLVAELGTIRRMSKRKPAGVKGVASEENNNEPDKSEDVGQSSKNLQSSNNGNNNTNTTAPIPAKRWSKTQPELLEQTLPPAYPGTLTSQQTEGLKTDISKVRPRSTVISNSDGDKMKPRHSTISTNEHSPRRYLETDL